MNFNHMTNDEAINAACNSGNPLALRLVSIIDELADEKQAEIEELKEELASHFVDEINDNIQNYLNEYYLNPESDYASNYDYVAQEGIQLSDIERVVDEIDRENYSARYCSGLTEETEEYILNLNRNQLEQLTADITSDLSASTEIEITEGYFATAAHSLYSIAIGEVSEEKSGWFENVPEELREYIENKIDAGFVSGDCIYFDLSDSAIHWVLNLEWLENWAEEQKNNDDCEG